MDLVLNSLGADDGTGDMKFLETVGQELKAQGVSFAAQWQLPLNDLQMGCLHNRLREADLQVTDVSTDVAYTGRKREWWYAEGSKCQSIATGSWESSPSPPGTSLPPI